MDDKNLDTQSYRWLPTMDLEPEMVLARPVFGGGSGNQLTMRLGVGSTLTASTIAQLVNKGVECVAVYRVEDPDPVAQAHLVECYQQRLKEIFGNEPDPACRHLFDALIEEGPSSC